MAADDCRQKRPTHRWPLAAIGQTRRVRDLLAVLDRPDGRAALEHAIEVVQALPETDPVRRAAGARRVLDADLATAALGQAGLRSAAAGKFGPLAASLLFTPDGLQQATRTELAAHRAARFAGAGIGQVLDLCCGIGADLLAFRQAGLAATGVERDPATARLARLNTGCPVAVGEAELADWPAAEAVFCDPARRTDRGRTFDPAGFSPPFGFVVAMLGTARYAAAKLAPGLSHALIPAGVEAEWVSFGGGVKEAVLWSTGFGRPGIRRRASVFPSGAQLTDADPATDAVGGLGDYLYEPDGAVIRAGLVRQVAGVLPGGRRIDEQLAYLAADDVLATPLARGYRVLDVLPYSVRRLRAELQRRRVGIVEIKKRGVDVDPARLRRELAPAGPNSLTVLLARVGERRLAVLADPV
jgi:SAM-dependent methyltransferase